MATRSIVVRSVEASRNDGPSRHDDNRIVLRWMIGGWPRRLSGDVLPVVPISRLGAHFGTGVVGVAR